MKNLSSMLSLLICFELILAPVIGQGGLFVSEARAEECQAGFQFDSTLNRCITSQQTAEIMNAVSNCNGDKECYKRNAEQALKDAEAENKIKQSLADKSGLMGKGMGIAAIAVPLLLVIQRLAKKTQCSAMSGYLMLGAGVATFAGEKLANGGHKKRIKKIKEEWDEILKTSTDSTKSDATPVTSPSTPDKALATEAQSEAFEMLAKTEDSMAKAASMKAGFYGAAAAMFAGAAVIAGIEQFKPAGQRCNDPKVDASDPGGVPGDVPSPGTEQLGPPTPIQSTPIPSALKIQQGAFIDLDDSSHETSFEVHPTKWNKTFVYNLINSSDLASFVTLQSSSNNQYSSPTIEEYETNKMFLSHVDMDRDSLAIFKEISVQLYYNLIPMGDAKAEYLPAENEIVVQAVKPVKAAAEAGGAASKAASTAAGKASGDILSSPLIRLVASGIFATWSAMMSMHAMKQAKISKKRAAFLRGMKSEFNDASSAINSCTAADRSNPSKLTCYCYTSAGQRNPERANSNVCQNLFNGKSLVGSQNYLASTSTKTCITNTGTEDAACSCRSSNSCAKVSVGGISGLDTGTFSMLNGATTDLNNLTNGVTDAASINPNSSISNAARLLDAANKNLSKTKQGQAIAKKKGLLAQDLANRLIASAAGVPNPYAGGGNSMTSLSPSQAVAELQDELKKAEPSINTASGGQTLAQPASDGPAEDALDFSLGGEQDASTATQVAEVMKQNLDYGQNDINNGSSENLFNVLSNRYQRSGMRRLFDEEGKTKADAPNKDDITK